MYPNTLWLGDFHTNSFFIILYKRPLKHIFEVYMCDVFVIFENHSQKKLSVFDRIKFSREIALIHFELIFIIT